MTDRRTKRAVLYARKSTKDERAAEQSASVETQLELGRKYAADHGWTVVAEREDDGRSGKLDRKRRPGLNEALQIIESDGADVLITLWTNRLSRVMRQWIDYLDVLDDHGVEWHATAEGGLIDRKTAMTRYMTNQRAAWAEFQSDLIGENWQRVHERRINSGLPKAMNPQFGYDIDYKTLDSGRKVDGKYVVNDAEAEVVQEVYRRYIRGDGFTTLVSWLNDGGWRVKGTGNEWTVRTLNRWMDVGFAAGFISREAHLRDAKGAHHALITEDTWLAYRAEREKRAPLGKGNGSAERWWLAGLVKCGECGGSTYIGGRLVCCTTHRSNPGKCSGGKSILKTYVEGAVGLWLGPHLDVLDQLVGHESRQVENASVAVWEAAKAKVEKIDAAIGKADAERLLDGVDNRSTIEHLRTLLATAKKERDEAAAAMHRDESPDLDLLRNGETWDPDRRAALRGVLDRIEVHADELRIYPIVGDVAVIERSSLHPRCNIDGCDKREATRGLCKSHSMRARNLGILDELAERVAASVESPGPTLTVEQVDALFASVAV